MRLRGNLRYPKRLIHLASVFEALAVVLVQPKAKQDRIAIAEMYVVFGSWEHKRLRQRIDRLVELDLGREDSF